MARRRIRRRRRTGRWAPSITKISSTLPATSGEFYNYEELAINPIQQNAGVSQTFTVKNIEINFSLEAPTAENSYFLEAITAFIMFAPQGMNITSSYYAEHPEYIMAYKYLGSPSDAQASNQQYQPIRLKTRLSRKLQTGDRVILFIQGSNNNQNTLNYNLFGLIRWWSKAN